MWTSPLVPEPARGRPPALAMLAAGAAMLGTLGLWLILAASTGLIFHFLPGAPFLAGAWAFREVGPPRAATWPEVAVILAVGGVAAVAGTLAVDAIGRELDTLPVTAGVALAGGLLAGWWLRRGGTSVAARGDEA